MRITGKITELVDGTKVYDINIPCNSNPKFGNKVIITCDNQEKAFKFVNGFLELVNEHTTLMIDEIDMEMIEEDTP